VIAMMRWRVYNNEKTAMLLIIEPSAIAFRIEPSDAVDIEGEFITTENVDGGSTNCAGEIEIGQENTVTLYMYPGATVWKGAARLKPLEYY